MKTGKQKCPQCSSSRTKNKNDKPLSVHYDNGELFFKCHHCGWKGKVEGSDRPSARAVAYTKPQYVPSPDTPNEKMINWFAQRGIPPHIVKRHQIEPREVVMPQTGKRTRTIAFPYYRDGQVVNVKYRTHDKLFRMEAGAELTFYGLDDIDAEFVVFVEGEMDKLSCETAGLTSCLSVPNGAGTNLDILAGVERLLEPVKKCILAGDNDLPGRQLQSELQRRLGPERCWRVEWPEGCKDANEVQMKHGSGVLRACIEQARPVPIEGAFGFDDLRQGLIDLYLFGRPSGVDPGWSALKPLYRPRPGQWTVITGAPGSGKSAFLRALLVNLALYSNLQFAVFPPEDSPPEEYFSHLLEVYLAKPFDKGHSPRMTQDEMLEAAQWVDKHFVILNPDDGERDFDSLLRLAKALVFRRGINGFVIDPWNEVEHTRAANMTETQYVETCLVKMRAFTQLHGLYNWIVAHPTKMAKEHGVYPAPTLYDIAGSAHWANKTDFGLSVYRDKTDDQAPVEIHVQKIRSRWCGQLGVALLHYDRVTGRYVDHRAGTDAGLPYAEAGYEEIQ
ncbi:MAG TPA: toprim domain-containing protein [Blastocatellia bacterium]|nr:toprim domain-containing protein [Blastocatellia bacterium]